MCNIVLHTLYVYGDNSHRYYYCNRAGKYEGRGKGIRQLKSQGSSKTGYQCAANMKVVHNTVTNRVQVEYCATHSSHSINLGHLRMSHELKMNIAGKLQEGVAMDRILDDIRDTISPDGVTREHLVTRKDIHNIRVQHNIEGIMRHKNDLTSVCAWIEEMKELKYNPVLLFKQQGEDGVERAINIGSNDFLLVLQTEFQRDTLRKHGHNTVCLDATYSTNAYDFKLVTLLVIDDFGTGVPVCWAISNREDTVLLTEMLKAVRKCTGALHPKWFMSDDAEEYFKAWTTVFGTNETKKLLCSWHVDRAWRDSIAKHVQDKEKRVEIYHHLQLLLMCTEEAQFRVYLQQFLTVLENTAKSFLSYFSDNYCSRLKQWARCFRVGSPLHTNMFVEAFHRTLKIVYLSHKQNRRLDFLLITLLKIARDKAYDSLIKSEKGKLSHRLCDINKRHIAANELLTNGKVVPIEGNKWRVSSQSKPHVLYTVERMLDECSCKLHCGTCKACAHMYSCTCLDASLQTTVCKHIHFVHIRHPPTNIFLDASSNQSHHLSYFSKVLHPNQTIIEPSQTKKCVQETSAYANSSS